MPANPKLPSLTIRALKAVGVEVPMTYALGTSRGAITKALLLIDLDTEQGIRGHAYLFCYLPAPVPLRRPGCVAVHFGCGSFAAEQFGVHCD
jgi:hypothetical protein